MDAQGRRGSFLYDYGGHSGLTRRVVSELGRFATVIYSTQRFGTGNLYKHRHYTLAQRFRFPCTSLVFVYRDAWCSLMDRFVSTHAPTLYKTASLIVSLPPLGNADVTSPEINRAPTFFSWSLCLVEQHDVDSSIQSMRCLGVLSNNKGMPNELSDLAAQATVKWCNTHSSHEFT